MSRFLLLTGLLVAGLARATGPAAERLTRPSVWMTTLIGAGDVAQVAIELLVVLAPAVMAWLLAVVALDVRAATRGTGRRHGPRWVRRGVDQVVGASLLLATMAGPAAAATAPSPTPVALELPLPEPTETPTPQAGVDGRRRGRTSPSLIAPVTPGAPSAGEVTSAPAGGRAAPGVPGPGSASTTAPPSDELVPVAEGEAHVVAAGENLWVIAREVLSAADQPADDRAVHRYWVRLIAANAAGLQSGDPDLVHPGERLVLPALHDAADTSADRGAER